MDVEEDSNCNIISYEEGYYFAPSQALVCKWLRDVHMIRVIVLHADSNGTWNYEIRIFDKPNTIGKWSRISNICSSNSYEEAELAGIKHALTLIQ